MISEPIFSEIVIRHIKAILDEVKEHEGIFSLSMESSNV